MSVTLFRHTQTGIPDMQAGKARHANSNGQPPQEANPVSQLNRQSDKQTDKQTGKPREAHADRQTGKSRHADSNGQTP